MLVWRLRSLRVLHCRIGRKGNGGGTRERLRPGGGLEGQSRGEGLSLTASWPENYISRDSSIQLNSQESAQSALVFRQGHHLSPQPSSWKPLPVLRIYILLQVWVDVFGVLSPRHLHGCVSRPELDRYFVDPFWISMNSSIFLSLSLSLSPPPHFSLSLDLLPALSSPSFLPLSPSVRCLFYFP